MPIYPAVALLVGSALSSRNRWVPIGTNALLVLFSLLFIALSAILLLVWRQPAPGNIANALTPHSELYTLSLGHIRDLTLHAFAYLKTPLGLAAFCLWGGGLRTVGLAKQRPANSTRRGGQHDSFLPRGSHRTHPIPGLLRLVPASREPPTRSAGTADRDDAYYAFSSVFFYTGRSALLLNGRENNLEYGFVRDGRS